MTEFEKLQETLRKLEIVLGPVRGFEVDHGYWCAPRYYALHDFDITISYDEATVELNVSAPEDIREDIEALLG